MPNLGAGEILVILLVALLVLGPDKLPGAAKSIGRGMAQFRRLSSGFEQEVRDAMHGAGVDSSPTSSASPQAASGTLHPGLGAGPRLEAGSVALGESGAGSGDLSSGNGAQPQPGPQDSRISSEGPSGSFS
jgi:Tat protein translocase TatB subunit